jgi:hypothetical protein
MEQVNIVEKEAPEESTMALYNDDKRGCLEVKKMISEGLKASLGEGAGVLDAPIEGEDIETILAAANDAIREFNRIDTVGNGVAAGYAVRNGKTLNLLKTKVKAAGENWIDYVKENIFGMSQRTIDKHIAISKIPGVENHFPLGIERIYLLSGAVNGLDSADPISELFSKYDLRFDPAVEMPFKEFKLKLDRIALQEKIAKEGLEIEEEVASKLIEREVTISDADFSAAKAVKSAGGKLSIFFNDKLASATEANTTPKSNRTSPTPPKRVQSFTKAAVQLRDVIKETTATTDEAILKDIDAAMIDDLLADLEALKAHLNNH